MHMRYVASELGTGLRRNVSMTIAVILTIWISLSLVGIGLMMLLFLSSRRGYDEPPHFK